MSIQVKLFSRRRSNQMPFKMVPKYFWIVTAPDVDALYWAKTVL